MKNRFRLLVSSLALVSALSLAQGQPADEEEVYELDPFTVQTSADEDSYLASQTLAGSRIRTDVRDLSTAISLITEQFIQDVAATDSESLLTYTLGTEVGGLSGNFSGLEPGGGEVESNALLTPQSNTRVRGLAAADNTRGFFLTDIPWDSFNVDRVEIQRGPNSILFGVGSPAGIVNANLIPAVFDDFAEVRLVLDDYGSIRGEFDLNRVLVDDVLAVRFSAMSERKKFMQSNNYEDDERLFGAANFRPKLFGPNNPTNLRASYEVGDIDANRPRFTPPEDRISPFFTSGPSAADGLNQQIFDPMYAGEYRIRYLENVSPSLIPPEGQPWLGRVSNYLSGAPVFFYDNTSDIPYEIRQSIAVDNLGLDEDGNLDGPDANGVYSGNIQGLPNGEPSRALAIIDYNTFTKKANLVDPSLYPGAAKNFYLNRHMTDDSIFDFYEYSLDGPNKFEIQEWEALNLALSQSFLSNRFGFELVYDNQYYEDHRSGRVREYISVDVSSHIPLIPTQYYPPDFSVPTGTEIPVPDPDSVTGGILNPNAGRAFAIVEPVNDSNFREIVRTNFRATAFVELRASDLFEEDSFLEKLLDRQRITGLYNTDERENFTRLYDSYKVDLDYVRDLGAVGAVSAVERIPASIIYLTGDLRGRSSAAGLNLDPVRSYVNPAGTYTLEQYFDPTWNAPGVAFDGFYASPLNGIPLTQSENHANYVGLTQYSAGILNASAGDIDQLTRSATRSKETVETEAVVYQGYFWNGFIVATAGWRKDISEVYAANGPRDPFTDVQSADFALVKPDTVNTEAPDDIERVEGETVSWGVVAHLTDLIRTDLPGRTRLSVFYNEAENFNPSIRFGFDGNPIPNQSGTTEEWGLVLSTLDDRLLLRLNTYETSVSDQDFSYNVNQFIFRRVPAWTTTAAIRHESYWEGYPGSNATFFSNPGWNALSQTEKNEIVAQFGGNPSSNLEAREFTRSLPQNQLIINGYQDWYRFLAENQDYWQNWFNQFSFDINLDPVVNGTTADRVEKTFLDANGNNTFNVVGAGPGSISSRTNGQIQGKFPTSAANTLSEGLEMEAQFKITPNWTVVFNAARTDATVSSVNEAFAFHIDFLNEALLGPAGNISRQGNGNVKVGPEFRQRITEPFLFALEQVGTSNPEIREWRFNLITTYRFTEGRLKGLSVGGAYRWQDDIILGYGIIEDSPGNWKQDVNLPIYGASEGRLDLWVGYRRRLWQNKIDWEIRLNVQNVGDDARLIPIYAEPDGTETRFRIAEGMKFVLSNSFKF